MSAREAISTARARRVELHHAMIDLEATLAQPTGAAGWRAAMRRGTLALRDALAKHNAATEAPGGIMDEMVEVAPRLDHRVTALRAEHPELIEATDALASAVDALDRGEPAVDALRAQALELLGALARHRQRGADLVYDAFDVDIGGQA